MIKYNAGGNTLRSRRYPEGNATALVIDRFGLAYVTGESGNKITTVKCNTLGNIVWVADYTYDLWSENHPMGIRVDDLTGNIYVVSNSGWYEHNVVTILKYSLTPTPVVHFASHIPYKFALEKNFPNPFNPETIIRYSLPSRSSIRLLLYDMLGREVTVPVNEEKSEGSYSVTWNAIGRTSGVYFCKMTVSDFSSTKKLLLLR